jgi:hypothetical protein
MGTKMRAQYSLVAIAIAVLLSAGALTRAGDPQESPSPESKMETSREDTMGKAMRHWLRLAQSDSDEALSRALESAEAAFNESLRSHREREKAGWLALERAGELLQQVAKEYPTTEAASKAKEAFAASELRTTSGGEVYAPNAGYFMSGSLIYRR